MMDRWRLWVGIYEQDKAFLLASANRILRDLALAEDCVHDTFIDLVSNENVSKKLEHCDQRSIRSYAVKAVQRHALKRLDKMGKSKEENIDEYLFLLAGTDLEAETEEKDERQRFWRVWNLLEKDVQRILYLKYYLELSDKEIGKLLSIRTSSVRMRLTRARRSAAEVFRANGYPGIDFWGCLTNEAAPKS